MAGYKELFQRYKGKEAAVKAGTKELEAAKEQVSGLEEQLRADTKAVKVLEPKVKEALAAEIKQRKSDLTKAKRALGKGDLEAAGRFASHERPLEAGEALVDTFKTSSYSADVLGKLQSKYKNYGDGTKLVEIRGYPYTAESALAAVVLAASNKKEEADKLMKGIELHMPKGKDGFYLQTSAGHASTYDTVTLAFAYAVMGQSDKAKKLVRLVEEKNKRKKGLVTTSNISAVAETGTNALLAATHAALGDKNKCDDYVRAIEEVIGFSTVGHHHKLAKTDNDGGYPTPSANAALSVAYRFQDKHDKAVELMKGVYHALSESRTFVSNELLTVSDMMRK